MVSFQLSEELRAEESELTVSNETSTSAQCEEESDQSLANSLFPDLMERAKAKRRAVGPRQGLSAGFQAESILSAYVNDFSTMKKCSNVLEFWQTNSVKYGKLSDIAIGYLTIPASTATIERVFSIAGDVVDVKRNRIRPKQLEMETMLRFNKKFIS